MLCREITRFYHEWVFEWLFQCPALVIVIWEYPLAAEILNIDVRCEFDKRPWLGFVSAVSSRQLRRHAAHCNGSAALRISRNRATNASLAAIAWSIISCVISNSPMPM